MITRKNRADISAVSLKIENTILTVVKEVKFLGVIFDKAFTWTQHIDYVIDRCKGRLNLMRCLSGTSFGAGKETLLIIYKALIIDCSSIIDYGSIAYDSTADSNKIKLVFIQGKPLRICCGSMIGCARSSLQVECGQPPLRLGRRRIQADYAVKILSISNSRTTAIMDDCWQNYETYPADREPFSLKVRAVLDAFNICDIPPAPPVPPPPWFANTNQPNHLNETFKTIADHVTSL